MDNNDLSNYFAQPIEAAHWIWAVENHIGPWVKAKGKSFWELVKFISYRRGVLKNLGREKFGELLIKYTHNVFSNEETPMSLKYSMDKFRYNDDIQKFDSLPDVHILKQCATELYALFDIVPETEEPTEEPVHTMESRLKDYLNETVDASKYAKIIEHPTYCNFTATFSVEQYLSQNFFDKGHPTHIMVFECVNETVDALTVTQLAGQYMMDRKIKLFIVSTHGFDLNTLSTAKNRDVGLIRVNPEMAIDEQCFVLPRSEESINLSNTNRKKMFLGRKEMSIPLLVYDGSIIGSSLSRVLKGSEIAIVESIHYNVPMLKHQEIEKIAYSLVKDKAEYYVGMLKDCDYHNKGVPHCEINPYEIARKRGLHVKRKKISSRKHLAHINIKKHEVTLNSNENAYSPRERFSMGHEVGHDVLHSLQENVLPDLNEEEKRIIEQQAYYFSSCLLMPQELTRLMYEIYWKKEFHQEKVLPLPVVKEKRYESGTFQRIIGPASRHLNVSMDALMWRLYDMNLIKFC